MQTIEGAAKTKAVLVKRNPNHYSDIAKLPRERKVSADQAEYICRSKRTLVELSEELGVSTRTISRYRKECR